MMLIGTCNAKWLKIKPSVIYGMIAVCILILICKYTALFLARYDFLGLDISEHINLIKNTGRALYLLVGVLYALILKGAYKKHMYTVNTTEKMKPYLIRYGVLSLVIEAAMIIIIMI